MAYTTVQKKAVHYTVGRDRPIRRIVLHWMATTLAGCDATFAGGQREASAHYGLEDDKRHQYVRESDTAWHAGDRTINHESIGIEHSAAPGRDATEATIANSIDLCTELCRRYGLTADAIDQHNDFYATQCPGTLPVSRIREAVRANLAGKPAPATAPQEDDVTPEDIKAIADEVLKRPVRDLEGNTLTVGAAIGITLRNSAVAATDARVTRALAEASAKAGKPLTTAEIDDIARATIAALGADYNAKVELTPKES